MIAPACVIVELGDVTADNTVPLTDSKRWFSMYMQLYNHVGMYDCISNYSIIIPVLVKCWFAIVYVDECVCTAVYVTLLFR